MVSQATKFGAHIGIDWAEKNMTIVFNVRINQIESSEFQPILLIK